MNMQMSKVRVAAVATGEQVQVMDVDEQFFLHQISFVTQVGACNFFHSNGGNKRRRLAVGHRSSSR